MTDFEKKIKSCIKRDEISGQQSCLFNYCMVKIIRNHISIYIPNGNEIPDNVNLGNNNNISFNYNNVAPKNIIFLKGIWVMLRKYVPYNAGHVLGDEVFSIWQTLHIFDIQEKCKEINIITDNKGPHLKQYECLTKKIPQQLSNFQGIFCFETLICGTDRQRYAVQGPRSTCLPEFRTTFDSFRKHTYDIFDIIPEKKKSIVFLDKCAEVSEHKCKLYEIDMLVDDVSVKYPSYNVKKISWKDMEMRNQVNVMESAEIVITLPGSDMMNCVFLRPGSTIICVCRFCENNRMEYSNEFGLWFNNSDHNAVYFDNVEKIKEKNQLYSKIKEKNQLYNIIDEIIKNK